MSEEYKIRRKRLHRKRHQTDDSDDELSEERRLMANSQERVRMQRINHALEDLKQVLPEEFHPCRRRMSKIRTLRSAMDYISGLSLMLEQDNERRREMYMQARQYVTSVQHECNVMYGENSNVYQSQTPTTYYPCLGPLCEDLSVSATPIVQQTPQKQTTTTSRQLFFNAPTKRLPQHIDVDITPDVITAGRSMSNRDGRTFSTTPSSNRKPCAVTSASTISSNFYGSSNNASDMSVMTAGYDVVLTRAGESRGTFSRAQTMTASDGTGQMTRVDLCND